MSLFKVLGEDYLNTGLCYGPQTVKENASKTQGVKIYKSTNEVIMKIKNITVNLEPRASNRTITVNY